MRHSKFALGQYLKFGNFIAKKLSTFKTVPAFFEILKTFQVIKIKYCRFRLRKCYYRVLVVKYKQSGLLKNADTVLNCK